jgi:predicted secreted protein
VATIAFLGKGTELKIDFGSGLTTVGEVRSITGPNLQGAQVDVTNMDSAGRLREFIAGLVDPGTLSFEVNYNPNYATHASILSDLTTNVTSTALTRTIQINFAQLSPAKGLNLAGFINSAPLTIPVDSQVTQNVEIQLSGSITAY